MKNVNKLVAVALLAVGTVFTSCSKDEANDQLIGQPVVTKVDNSAALAAQAAQAAADAAVVAAAAAAAAAQAQAILDAANEAAVTGLLAINGAVATELSAELAAIFGVNYYGLNFDTANSNEVEAFYASYGDTCATYDGYWVIVDHTSTEIVLSGADENFIIITFVDETTLDMYAEINKVVIEGTLASTAFPVCTSGKGGNNKQVKPINGGIKK